MTGYIYIPNWDAYQHGNKREHPWIKLYQSLLGDEAWLDLNPSDSKLLVTVWLCCSKYGNGRVRAANGWLNAQANTRKGSLERLIHAGFIEIRASKALAIEEQDASPEVEVLRTSTKSAGARESAAPRSEEESDTDNNPDELNLETAAKTAARIAALTKQAALAQPADIAPPPWIQTNQRLAAQKSAAT